ncbi:M23 family metallopeptidase [uncultured Microbacterium sp.]|uniref:M23 family metallopeptidase n=1 Tax=uncultured Microbacterium sp. TaxID=191216 RepID=UPI0025CC7961|nr:M23 family metallopeptidase [uncultured Microbacterium sp.]
MPHPHDHASHQRARRDHGSGAPRRLDLDTQYAGPVALDASVPVLTDTSLTGSATLESSCGCAPTAAERAGFAAAVAPASTNPASIESATGAPAEATRPRTSLTRRIFLGVGAAGLIGVAAYGASGPAFAQLAGYPSWDDVQAAKGNEAAKAAEIQRIQGLINDLQGRVASTQAAADKAASVYAQAQMAFEDAAQKADDLQAQADAQAAIAKDASDKAARVAAQLYRSGGDDTALQLFFSGSAANADDLLTRLGGMDKLVDRNQNIYATAVAARNNAQTLSDQAAAQRNERDRLQKEAASALQAAQDAATAAQAALDEQATYLTQLQGQLAALQDTTAKTVAEYQAGVAEEKRQREEAERRAREEAARLAAEAEARRRAEEEARQNAGNGNGGGSGGGGSSGGGSSGGGGGQVIGSGWARPSSGWISSWYGDRGTICSNGYCTSGHRGIDFATGCGAAIFAAAPGRVIVAANLDSWGNCIRIDHGGGLWTAYAHIQNGGMLVGVGAQVSAGQLIAREGATGLAQGCHLHFEVWTNGVRIDPAPVLRSKGISL